MRGRNEGMVKSTELWRAVQKLNHHQPSATTFLFWQNPSHTAKMGIQNRPLAQDSVSQYSSTRRVWDPHLWKTTASKLSRLYFEEHFALWAVSTCSYKKEQCQNESWLRVKVIDSAECKGILLKHLLLLYSKISNNKQPWMQNQGLPYKLQIHFGKCDFGGRADLPSFKSPKNWNILGFC